MGLYRQSIRLSTMPGKGPTRLTIEVASYCLVEGGEFVGLERTVILVANIIDLEKAQRRKSQNVSRARPTDPAVRSAWKGGRAGLARSVLRYVARWRAGAHPGLLWESCWARRGMHTGCCCCCCCCWFWCHAAGRWERHRLLEVEAVEAVEVEVEVMALLVVVVVLPLLAWLLVRQRWPSRCDHVSLVISLFERSVRTQRQQTQTRTQTQTQTATAIATVKAAVQCCDSGGSPLGASGVIRQLQQNTQANRSANTNGLARSSRSGDSPVLLREMKYAVAGGHSGAAFEGGRVHVFDEAGTIVERREERLRR